MRRLNATAFIIVLVATSCSLFYLMPHSVPGNKGTSPENEMLIAEALFCNMFFDRKVDTLYLAVGWDREADDYRDAPPDMLARLSDDPGFAGVVFLPASRRPPLRSDVSDTPTVCSAEVTRWISPTKARVAWARCPFPYYRGRFECYVLETHAVWKGGQWCIEDFPPMYHSGRGRGAPRTWYRDR